MSEEVHSTFDKLGELQLLVLIEKEKQQERQKVIEEVEEILDNLRKSNDMWRMNQDEMGDFILKQLSEGKENE